MPKLLVHSKARDDLVQISDYIASENLAAALRVHKAIEKAIHLVTSFPHIGTDCDAHDSELAGLRFWPVKKYRNYLVIYKPTEDGIEIVRVFHAARDLARVLRGRQ